MDVDCRVVNGQTEPWATGYFRDGMRRVDLVLVVADTSRVSFERAKLDFLLAAIDAGIELELELGVMPEHKQLTFVKVHCGSPLLAQLGELYDLHKPLRSSHAELVRPSIFLMEMMCPFLTIHYEREWINLIRAEYPGSRVEGEGGPYSTIDRSKLVYRVLQNIRFASHELGYGLDRLLEVGVFRDAFPLHDGPYFCLPKQLHSHMTGRQVLFLNWVGYKNMAKAQPLHIIREYLGERDRNSTKKREWGNVEYHDMPVCPKCRDFSACPFRNLSAHGTDVREKTAIDNPAGIFFSFLFCIWAILLHLYWRRREAYLSWLWEVNKHEPENTVRSQYNPHHRRRYRTLFQKLKPSLIRFAVSLGIISFYVLGVISILVLVWERVRACIVDGDPDTEEIAGEAVLMLIAITAALLAKLADRTVARAAYISTDLMNARTEAVHERALVTKLCGYGLLFNFGFIFIVALIKGQMYTFPSDPARWPLMLGLGVQHCGPLGCIDELNFIYTTMFFIKKVFDEIIIALQSKRTDYTMPSWVRRHAPCWEREYALRPLTDAYIMEIYSMLILQLTSLALFSYILPVAAVFTLIVNTWGIRHIAREVLLRRRRPLMHKSWGLGYWRGALFMLPYIATAVNAMTVSLNSHIFDVIAFNRYFSSTRFFVDFTMSFFNTSDYEMSTEAKAAFDKCTTYCPSFCLFPGKWNRRTDSQSPPEVVAQTYEPLMAKWYINWNQLAFFMIYVHLILVIGVALHNMIPAVPSAVVHAAALETALKDHLANTEADQQRAKHAKHVKRRTHAKRVKQGPQETGAQQGPQETSAQQVSQETGAQQAPQETGALQAPQETGAKQVSQDTSSKPSAPHDDKKDR